MNLIKNIAETISVAIVFIIFGLFSVFGVTLLNQVSRPNSFVANDSEKSGITNENINQASLQGVYDNDKSIENNKDLGVEYEINDNREYLFPEAKVVKVVDGDTLHVNTRFEGENTSNLYKVRLIGINTPETVDPRKEVECFGIESSDKAKELLEGRIVRIELDNSQGKFDRYGRLLAYVYVDNILINETLIKGGYAYEYTYDTPYKYQDDFKKAEMFARENKIGLWADNLSGVNPACRK